MRTADRILAKECSYRKLRSRQLMLLLSCYLTFQFLCSDLEYARLLGPSTAEAADISYIYDDLGRLKAVVDPAADTAVYHYDSVGNLLSIARQSSSIVSIIEFTPKKGPVGTSVTIYGTGFSATPSQNSVTFNGASATVTSSTATKIIATVPAGATTGTIGVTAPLGSANSSQVFTVGDSDAPTITGFSPTISAVGTPVTVTGTNFETIPSANILRFNLTPGSASAATATSLSTTVSAFTSSGRVSVTTRYGKAVSNSYMFIAPPPFTAADVGSTGTITPGVSQTVTVSTAGKIALRVIEGVPGQSISVSLTNNTLPGCNSLRMSC